MIKKSGKKKMGEMILIVVVVLVVNVKGRSGEVIKRAKKITLKMDLALLSLMESGTCCVRNTVVGIKPIPQYSMARTNQIHQIFYPKYLPLIPAAR